MLTHIRQLAMGILQQLRLVDGPGSGLDADLLDGQEATAFDPYAPWFGDGSDGDLTVTNGQTVTITTSKHYRNLTVESGGTLIVGEDNSAGHLVLRVSGTLTVAGTIRPGRWRIPPFMDSWGQRRTTAGSGNVAIPYYYGHQLFISRSGAGGNGGGDGTNNGGTVNVPASWSNQRVFYWIRPNEVAAAATTGAGANGFAPAAPPGNYDYFSCPRLPGEYSCGGASGALKTAGGSNYGGAGGNYQQTYPSGGGVLDICARTISVAATGVIAADGEDGRPGENGHAANALGDIAGGGGGAGGAGGGVVCLLYRTLTNAGTIRAAGGNGGAGGLGREYTAGGPNQPRASSNGGNGGAGQSGLVVTTRI